MHPGVALRATMKFGPSVVILTDGGVGCMTHDIERTTFVRAVSDFPKLVLEHRMEGSRSILGRGLAQRTVTTHEAVANNTTPGHRKARSNITWIVSNIRHDVSAPLGVPTTRTGVYAIKKTELYLLRYTVIKI